MARDRAACVARQAAVSRHGAGRSRRACGRAGSRRGAQGRRQQAPGACSWRVGKPRVGAVGHGRLAAGARGLGAWSGRAGWLRAVHSVHSACFRFDLTQYCS